MLDATPLDVRPVHLQQHVTGPASSKTTQRVTHQGQEELGENLLRLPPDSTSVRTSADKASQEDAVDEESTAEKWGVI